MFSTDAESNLQSIRGSDTHVCSKLQTKASTDKFAHANLSFESSNCRTDWVIRTQHQSNARTIL